MPQIQNHWYGFNSRTVGDSRLVGSRWLGAVMLGILAHSFLAFTGNAQTASTSPSVVYVDASYPAENGTVVTFPKIGGTGAYEIGRNAFPTIQAAADRVAAGGTISVAAGTYIENISIQKALSLVGPNAGKSGVDSSRGPEAIILPSINDPENIPIISVEASHTLINGFLLDGHNPALSGGYDANGVPVHAAAGVQNGIYPNTTDVDHITVQNNIVRNLSYDGVCLDRFPFLGASSGWNYILNNKFENMWEGLLTYSVEAVIAHNTITNVTHGLSVHGAVAPAPTGFAPIIASNTLSIAQWWPVEISLTRAPGIWVNYRRENASPLRVVGNVIDTPTPAGA
ncbi:MAG TPA: hypothetical protein VEC99_00175, partial [Clostridia bacterium]|nr:hypothetical protein [Clostridia bacterium]